MQNVAQFAKMLGLDGVEIDNPEQIGPAWDAAPAADRPPAVSEAIGKR
jgi:pyruvate dehydrogenase (quinone)